MNFIKTCNNALFKVERALTVISFISMIALMAIQVVFRYIIGSSLAWSEEMMRFLFIFSSFFGASCATYVHGHVVIDFLGIIVKKIVKGENNQEKVFDYDGIIVDVVGVVFFLYMAKVMFTYSMTLKSQGALSASMLMPLHWLGIAIVIAMVCCAIHFFCEIFLNLEKIKLASKGGEQ